MGVPARASCAVVHSWYVWRTIPFNGGRIPSHGNVLDGRLEEGWYAVGNG